MLRRMTSSSTIFCAIRKIATKSADYFNLKTLEVVSNQMVILNANLDEYICYDRVKVLKAGLENYSKVENKKKVETQS